MEQLHDYSSNTLDTSLPEQYYALSGNESSFFNQDFPKQSCLSTPAVNLSSPQFGYNSLSPDTLYSSMKLEITDYCTESPASPSGSSTGSSSDTESTGVPSTFSSKNSKADDLSQSRVRRTSKCSDLLTLTTIW